MCTFTTLLPSFPKKQAGAPKLACTAQLLKRLAILLALCLGVVQGSAQAPHAGYPDGANPSPNSGIFSVALQSDGKILIGGSFTQVVGSGQWANRNRIARLESSGTTVDLSFNPGSGADNTINAIALQPDGKIIIAGSFTNYNGTARTRIARLNSNGSLDTSFDPGTGANGTIKSIVRLPDGKILIGGYFTDYNGTGRNRIARLNSNGSLDTSFDPGTGANWDVDAVALQPDGRILIGGRFTAYNGIGRGRIARLNSNGSLDTSFDPGTGVGPGAVFSILVQSDGKIMLGGGYTTYNGISRNCIVRINSNGSLDTSFDPGTGVQGVGASVLTMQRQSDGKYIIMGGFDQYNGNNRTRIARIQSNGALDNSFIGGTCINPGGINTSLLQPDDKLIIGGTFTHYCSGVQLSRNRFARLYTKVPLFATISSTNTNCGYSNGSITLSSPSGGSGAYQYRLNSGAWQSNPTFSGLGSGTYAVWIRDANNIGDQVNLGNRTISQIQLNASVSRTNVTCNGSNNGIITISSPSGAGSGSYQYRLNSGNWQSGGIFTGLAPGTYTVWMRDAVAQACTRNLGNQTITQPGQLIASVSKIDANCFGANNGSITINSPSGGSGSYQYRLNSGAWQGGNTFTGLAPGTYTVWIRDANAQTCTRNLGNQSITQPAALGGSSAKTDVTCHGANDGSITVSATGGSGTYQYQLNSGAWQNSNLFTGLAAGVYAVNIRDLNATSCQTTLGNQTITQPSALTATVTLTELTCNGTNNGVITVSSPAGGSGAFEYRLSAVNFFPSVDWQSSGTFTGLPEGAVYSVQIRDANQVSCVVSLGDQTVTRESVVVTANIVQPQCFTFGAISLSVSGGTAPYTYNWSDIPGTSNPKDRSGLAAGTYEVTVTDAEGCVASSGVLTLNEPLDCQPCNLCENDASSEFFINPDPSITLYTWSVPPGATLVSGQGTSQIEVDWTGVPPGTYSVCVEALNVCGTSAQRCEQVNIFALPDPMATASQICAGGSFNLFATGGASYSWTGPNGFVSSSSNPVILNANAATHNGLYEVTVTNLVGCEATASVLVSVNPAPQLTASVTNAACGLSDGSIDLSVSGGTPGYSYVWSNGATTEDLSALPSGGYGVTVTDASGCSASEQVSVSNTGGPSIAQTQTNPSCLGDLTGAIDVTVSGGVPPYSFLWSNGATSEDVSSLGVGLYVVTVTDANSCQSIASSELTAPSALILDYTKTDVDCFGEALGSINLVVVGGTAPYSYTWTQDGLPFGGNTPGLSNLTAGLYAVTVTDANNCTAFINTTISQPANALHASSDVTGISCFGADNAQIVLTISGGTLPYSFSWSGPGGFTATTKSITGLSAGTYDVTITDGRGCSVTLLGNTVNEPALLTASALVTASVNCFDGTDGSLESSIAGGTMPYTYLWSNGATTEDVSGLPAGTYTLTVTDANNCTAVSAAVNLGQPAAPLSATTSVTNAGCFGTATGSVDVSVSGGTMPYTYTWSNGASTEDLSNVPAGDYSVTIVDANMCVTIRTATIEESEALELSGVVSNLLCFGATTGAIDLSLSGGMTPFSYNWSDGSTDEDRTNLGAGIYEVTVTDVNNCTGVESFTISAPSQLMVSPVQTDITCFGATDGGISLTITGGVAPYTVLWSNSETSQDLSGLAAGVYSATITDAQACTVSTGNITVNQPASPLAVVVSAADAACAGTATGTIDLAISGGTAPYTFLWSNGATTEDLVNIAAGSYAVTINDANLCAASTSQVIGEPDPIALSGTVTDLLCFGASTASIDLTVTGGTAPYTYNWSDGLTSQDRSDLPAGTYQVTVTDANACQATELYAVSAPSVLTVVHAKTDIACFGAMDGGISLLITGGVAPYTVLWSNNETSQDLSGLAAGVYSATITDAQACTITTGNITINQPASAVTVVAAATDANCLGAATGGIELTVSGGTAPYIYTWSDGATTKDISGVPAGNYLVTVTDANLCTATSSATVGEPAKLELNGSITDVSCFGASTGAIELLVMGGTAPYTYNWTKDGNPYPGNTANITGLATGLYAVTATDVNGCEVYGVYVLDSPIALDVVAVKTDVGCFGEDNGSVNLTVSGGVVPYSFAWSNGATDQFISNLVAGTYTVTITDANNCEITLTADPINEPDPIMATASLIQNVTCKDGNDGSATVIASGGTGAYTYYWSNGAQVQTPANLPASSSYTVTVTDAAGCETQAGPVTVSEPATSMVLYAGVTPTSSCGGNTGAIELFIDNGTLPFSFAWSGPTATGNVQNPSGLAIGAYEVTVTDGLGCTAELSTTVGTADPLTAEVFPRDPSCSGPDGNVLAVASGGVGPYAYLWSQGGATGQQLSDLGAGTYTVTITDANNCTAIASGTLTDPVSCNPPTAQNDVFWTVMNTPVMGTVLPADPANPGHDSDPFYSLMDLSVELLSDLGGISAGGLDLNEDGSFTFTPTTGFFGVVYFEYEVCNPEGLCDEAFLVIHVNTTFASNDLNQAPSNTTVSGNVLTNDIDPEGDTQNVLQSLADTNGDGLLNNPVSIGTSTPVYGVDDMNMVVTAGNLTLNADGTYQLVPELDFSGVIQFMYTVTDDNVAPATDDALVRIRVLGESEPGENSPPFALDDTNTTDKGISVSGNVLLNDGDVDGDPIELISVLADTDGNGALDNALVLNTLTIIYGVNLLGNTVIAGTLVLDAAGDYTFNPDDDFAGTVGANYTISELTPSALTDNAFLFITVTPLSTNSTFAQDDVSAGLPGVVQTGNVLDNDFDPQGDAQSVSSAMADLTGNGVSDDVLPLGVPTIVYGFDQMAMPAIAGELRLNSNGSFTFTPAVGFEGFSSATYIATDDNPNPASDGANLVLSVNADPQPGTNDPPVASGDVSVTHQGVTVTGNVLVNDYDPDGDPISVVSALADLSGNGLLDEPLNLNMSVSIYGTNQLGMLVLAGQISLNAQGDFTFVPSPDFLGQVQISYTISDPDGLTDSALLTITVNNNSVNTTYANDDLSFGFTGEVQTGNVLDNDHDPQGHIQLVTGAVDFAGAVITVGVPAVLPSGGTLLIEQDGSFVYTPEPSFIGTETVVYSIIDAGALAATDMATLSLRTQDPPFVKLATRVLLQGALFDAPDNLMRDDLRQQGFIPVQEPYTNLGFTHTNGGGGEQVADPVTVFADYGANSIVDWVLVELRDANSPSTILATRAGLVQRDGDVVDVDGVSPLVFSGSKMGNYFVAVRHRNHLGAMTEQPAALTTPNVVVDFTTASLSVYNTASPHNGNERVLIGSQYALWAGNTLSNDKLVYAGQNSDVVPVFNKVDQAVGNVFKLQSYILLGYSPEDVTMDGRTIYAGQDSDVILIFNNIDAYPANIFKLQNYFLPEQLAHEP